MKKLLLGTLVIGSLLMSDMLRAEELTLTIIETHLDGGVSISFDDGEYENDSIDKVDDDDLDMGWEGEDLNVMTAFTRFQNVTIPQGAVINSAVLKLYAHEDEEDEAYVTIYGEATGNSEEFAEDEALSDRTATTASVSWDIVDPWTIWQAYETPDLTSIIQEIVNLEAWESGNALTIFIQGNEGEASLLDNARDFESYENIEDPNDGGDGLNHPERAPRLVITYGETTAVDQLENNLSFSVFPNPSTEGMVNVKLVQQGSTSINILDACGKAVYQMRTDSQINTIDISNLSTGIYFIRASNEYNSTTQKLVVK
ncbi:MAG: T9SS type A sorting domain-containing protein [Bacteroidales bacterium]|nr:T9SS type A sorting domain-containing protein [Bacteroidales bacterium]